MSEFSAQLLPVPDSNAAIPPCKIDPDVLSQIVQQQQAQQQIPQQVPQQQPQQMFLQQQPQQTFLQQQPQQMLPQQQQMFPQQQQQLYQQNTAAPLTTSYIDQLYQEFRVPIRLFVLFILFQLPKTKQYLITNAPFMATDGEYNVNGCIATALVFSVAYFIWNRLIDHILGAAPISSFSPQKQA